MTRFVSVSQLWKTSLRTVLPRMVITLSAKTSTHRYDTSKLKNNRLSLGGYVVAMEAFVDTFELWVGDVCVDLGCRDIAVAEHRLYAA